MFQFTIATDKLNPLLYRLSGLVKGDDLATITFSVESEDFVEVYYRSKIDGGDLTASFSERLPILSHQGFGCSTLLIKEIAGLKFNSFTKVDSFPHTKDVSFWFHESVLKVNYNVIYGAGLKPTEMKLAYGLCHKTHDPEEFESLSSPGESVVMIDTAKIKEAVQYCNFFRGDATSKEGNGCLVAVSDGTLSVLGTDSNMAALYRSSVSSSGKGFSIVLSDVVFKLLDRFIADTDQVELSLKRSWLHVSTGSRKTLVPTMSTVSMMEAYVSLFSEPTDAVSILPAKPVIDAVSTLIVRSVDSRNRVDVSFKKNAMDIETSKNSTKNLPCEVTNSQSMSINGEYLITALKRIMKSSPSLSVSYKADSNRWCIASQGDHDVTFLVQGLSV
jgi:hypothetical protein